jgi:hypothetical protein
MKDSRRMRRLEEPSRMGLQDESRKPVLSSR